MGTAQYQRMTYGPTHRPGVPSNSTSSWTTTSDYFAFAGTASQLIYDFGQTSNRWGSAEAIATELITKVRTSVTIDWTLRESARAKIRVIVKRILNKFGYPPDLQEEAVKTVLMQAELLCAGWAA